MISVVNASYYQYVFLLSSFITINTDIIIAVISLPVISLFQCCFIQTSWKCVTVRFLIITLGFLFSVKNCCRLLLLMQSLYHYTMMVLYEFIIPSVLNIVTVTTINFTLPRWVGSRSRTPPAPSAAPWVGTDLDDVGVDGGERGV